VGGGKAWIFSFTKRGGPGTSIDIPFASKDALYGKGRWRVVSPAPVDEAEEEALGYGSARARLQRLVPIAEPYEILHTNLYKVHQRVAARFRCGRIFLAGDSAHINNSIGGLGLNSGIHDAMELAEALDQVISKRADESLLDRYERRWRTMNIEFVQQATIINKKRLEERDPAARQARLGELRATAADPVRHKEFLMRSSLIESVQRRGSCSEPGPLYREDKRNSQEGLRGPYGKHVVSARPMSQ
jgi:3-(3-hydroxy-phenyl)propionate hydroxylase